MHRENIGKERLKKIRERPIRFYVSLNQQEYEIIVQESRKAGVPRAAYMRAMAFQGRLIARLTDEERSLFKEMVGISNGLNQLIRIAREKGLADLLPVFECYREAMDALLNKIKL